MAHVDPGNIAVCDAETRQGARSPDPRMSESVARPSSADWGLGGLEDPASDRDRDGGGDFNTTVGTTLVSAPDAEDAADAVMLVGGSARSNATSASD
jgi:hypothetical protein